MLSFSLEGAQSSATTYRFRGRALKVKAFAVLSPTVNVYGKEKSRPFEYMYIHARVPTRGPKMNQGVLVLGVLLPGGHMYKHIYWVILISLCVQYTV